MTGKIQNRTVLLMKKVKPGLVCCSPYIANNTLLSLSVLLLGEGLFFVYVYLYQHIALETTPLKLESQVTKTMYVFYTPSPCSQ